MIKLGIYVFLVVMSLLQFWISRYSDCSNATSIVAMCNAGAFLLIFLLYFPLYGIQVKNIVIRQCLSILAPVCLTVYGICISEHLGCFVCRSNHTLSSAMFTRVESIVITLCGIVKLVWSIYNRTEYSLYSKDFDEAYEETEKRINAIMEAQRMVDVPVTNTV
ncbi:hypothetical protein WA171_000299 [Blastocystis sp. BT1]